MFVWFRTYSGAEKPAPRVCILAQFGLKFRAMHSSPVTALVALAQPQQLENHALERGGNRHANI